MYGAASHVRSSVIFQLFGRYLVSPLRGLALSIPAPTAVKVIFVLVSYLPSGSIPVILLSEAAALEPLYPFTVTLTAITVLIPSGFFTPSGSLTVPFTLNVCLSAEDGL